MQMNIFSDAHVAHGVTTVRLGLRTTLTAVAVTVFVVTLPGCLPDFESESQLNARIDALRHQGDILDPDATANDDIADGLDDTQDDVVGDAEDATQTFDIQIDTGSGQTDTTPAECQSNFDCAQLYKGQTPCSFYICNTSTSLCEQKIPSEGTPCTTVGQSLSSCQQSTCDGLGSCTIKNETDGTHCGFGKCGNKCASGECVPATASDYSDNNPCTQDYCDQGKEVVHKPIADLSLSCDDGNLCTESDSCVGGACIGIGKDCSDAFGCTQDLCDPTKGCVHTPKQGVCDDDDPCTKDACDAAVGCTVTGDELGVVCDDGNTCTLGEACAAGGSCEGGTSTCACKTDADCISKGDACRPMICSKGFCEIDLANAVTCSDASDTVCVKNTCAPQSGTCKLSAAKDDIECDDGDSCTQASACLKGACVGLKPKNCNDSNPCTDDSCAAGQGCVNLANQAACSDGDACTTDDKCQGSSCAATKKSCDDNINCTFDSCDPTTGKCSHKADDAKCNDGSTCTDDTCGVKGCAYAANDKGACDDGDKCTSNACKGGTCAVTAFTCGCEKDATCDDGNPCTTNSCTGGKCSAQILKDGGSCSTGDKCQAPGSGMCASGICVSGNKPKSCDLVADACNKGVCTPATGECVKVALTDGTTCDADKNGCSVADSCTAGKCVAGKPADCSAVADACNSASCKSGGSSVFSCIKTPHIKGTECTDGKFCTVGDACDGKGTCASSGTKDCASLTDECNTGVCNDTAKACEAAPKSKGTPCNDGFYCTEDDACTVDGKCKSGKARECKGSACQATSCDDSQDKCAQAPSSLGTGCDDGNLCSIGDSCDGSGDCAGKMVECDDGNGCTVDTCDKKTGKCAHSPKANLPCSDGDTCTLGESCDDKGGCTGGTAKKCPGGSCVQATCNSATGQCGTTPEAPGTGCSDGNACTQKDNCDGKGTCVGGAAKACDGGDACYADACDAKTGNCTTSPRTAGTPCSDGNACTESDACDGKGVCAAGAEKSCPSGPCATATCDPKTGSCTETPFSDGLECDDKNACTTGDVCKSGACVADKYVCECKVDKDCDDKVACTKDSCVSAGGQQLCSYSNFQAQEASCSDGDPCTTNDSCKGGQCNGAAVKCDDKNPCTADKCDATTGKCVAPATIGAKCNDGNVCTTSDTCAAGGVCKGAVKTCSDGNPCTTDACDGATGNCSNVNHTKSCNDGNACTKNDVCAGGVCKGQKKNCSDTNPCTVNSCTSKTGKCAQDALVGAKCDDGNACTTADACNSEALCKGKAVKCDDGNPCTAESCDTLTGTCKSTIKTGQACSDGDACTTIDTCSSKGVCVGSKPNVCSGDACNSGVCNTKTGSCEKKPKIGGTSCDDGDACATDDVCDGTGKCVPGKQVVCPGDACSVGVCVSPLGTCSKQPLTQGADCSDGNACTTGDACDGKGTCKAGGIKQCPSDACSKATCNPTNGACGKKSRPVGTGCNDGNACTKVDSCNGAGTCVGAQPVSCAGNACNDGVCDPGSGSCGFSPKTNGTQCSDSQACTVGDTCKNGTCAAGPWQCQCKVDADCDDNNACTTNACETSGGQLVCQKPPRWVSHVTTIRRAPPPIRATALAVAVAS